MAAPTEVEHAASDARQRTIDVTVDGELVTLLDQHQTPNAVLVAAGIDPATNYLVRIDGRHQHSYKDHGDDPITVHPGETFVSVYSGPTPVS